MLKKITTILMLLFISNISYAGSAHGAGTVKNVYFHSKDSITSPDWAGMLQLEIESLSWNIADANCSTQYVGVRENDTHIISAVLAAKMAGRSITIYVNEDLKVLGPFCFVRAVGV